jgi:hypothetical protein
MAGAILLVPAWVFPGEGLPIKALGFFRARQRLKLGPLRVLLRQKSFFPMQNRGIVIWNGDTESYQDLAFPINESFTSFINAIKASAPNATIKGIN